MSHEQTPADPTTEGATESAGGHATEPTHTGFHSAIYVLAIIGLWQVVTVSWVLLKDPALLWSMLSGTPYSFEHAVQQIELKPVANEEFQTTNPLDLSIAAGIVVSEDSIRAYDLGPNMDISAASDFEYPRDDFELELWNYNLHRDHQSGQLITPLMDWLSERAHTLKVLMGRDVSLRVFIAVDRQAGFEIERQIMYTAGQAQHTEIVKVVDSAAGIRLKPNDYPSIGLPEAVGSTDPLKRTKGRSLKALLDQANASRADRKPSSDVKTSTEPPAKKPDSGVNP